jgi:hypothetical protein
MFFENSKTVADVVAEYKDGLMFNVAVTATPEEIERFEARFVDEATDDELAAWTARILQTIADTPVEARDIYNAMVDAIMTDESLSEEEKAANLNDVTADFREILNLKVAV